MKRNQTLIAALALSAIATAVVAQQPAPPAQPAAPPPPMSFFVTSTPPGHGNLGGLAGADATCQSLATAAGSTKTWRAYLSTQAEGQTPAVNARDRIGTGPWFNSKGVRIAANVTDLHGDLDRDRNFINKTSALDEKGNVVNGVGDTPNQHDVLTGSDSVGRAWQTADDRTCKNWTSADPSGRAFLGHTDRLGGGNTSWNSAHPSAGCDADRKSTRLNSSH